MIINNSQNPQSFGWPAKPAIQPFTYTSANGFLPIAFPAGVAVGTADLWTAFLTDLEPLISGGFKPGTCWGYEDRLIANSSNRSFHSYGLALDVNAPYNGRGGKGGSGQYQIPTSAIAVAHKYGMESGLEWDYTDPMHFEIHLSPDDVKNFSTTSSFTGASSTPATSPLSIGGFDLTTALPIIGVGVAIVGGLAVVASQIK